jgi:hypothetical protein
MWRWLAVVVLLGGCRQLFGIGDPTLGTGDSNRGDDAFDGPMPDGACGWPFVPSNFDPCALPSPTTLPAPMSNKITLDSDSMAITSIIVSQPGAGSIRVIHLSGLSLASTDTLVTIGSMPIVFAVDTGIVIDGQIVAEAGAAIGCTETVGAGSTQGAGGGGGGAGGAGAEFGGDGGDGGGPGAGIHGTHGAKRIDPTLVPLVSGCPGRGGGTNFGVGTPALGGVGGGAIQMSSQSGINFGGQLFAVGLGGAGGPSKAGGGGGGAGGAILLEAPSVHINTNAFMCADGGSGGEGGDSGNTGADGTVSPCNRMLGATTTSPHGSPGGSGGFALSVAGAAGGNAGGGSAGGGGGGGGVGWIHLRGTVGLNIESTATVTPDPH